MKRKALYFVAPEKVEVREEPVESPGAGQVGVRSLLSAISTGTEMLVYRGQVPRGMALDASIAALGGDFYFPLKYGYSNVGRVSDVGVGVDPQWQDRLVFAFHPHESYFIAHPEDLIVVPEGIAPEDAVFLPNMETAVNFLMDGRPMIGEFAAVFGLGIVGLLTTALLLCYPLAGVVCVDKFARRRGLAEQLGICQALDPDDREGRLRVREELREQGMADGVDLAFELSGAPAALDDAIALTGFAGRVVIGSWYGTKTVQLDLGGRFHRSRIQLISSQVSSIQPELLGRWNKSRRLDTAWKRLGELQPSRWITQRIPFDLAQQAYHLLDKTPEETVQVVLDYQEH